MNDLIIRETFQEAYKTWNVKLPEMLEDWGEFSGYSGWQFCYFKKIENGIVDFR